MAKIQRCQNFNLLCYDETDFFQVGTGIGNSLHPARLLINFGLAL